MIRSFQTLDHDAEESQEGNGPVRIKNINNLMHFPIADAALSPTVWQANTFPTEIRNKIRVIHDGIDTTKLVPSSDVSLTINNTITITKNDEILTFVNRDLEPMRGYHIFMRSLPIILNTRKSLRVLIIGGNGVSYGAASKDGRSWKDIFIEEVRPKISEKDWQRVHFLGKVPYDQFVKVLQISTVHVYLTYPFVLSWSLLEAMSVGCAIVASDTSPVREFLEDDVTAKLLNFFDIDGLANTVLSLLNDPLTREKIGMQARASIKERADLSQICLPKQLEWVDSLFH